MSPDTLEGSGLYRRREERVPKFGGANLETLVESVNANGPCLREALQAPVLGDDAPQHLVVTHAVMDE